MRFAIGTVPYYTSQIWLALLNPLRGEPSLLSIPNEISLTNRYNSVVRILHPISFSLWFGVRGSVRSIHARVGGYRSKFFSFSTYIRNKPPGFFQNTKMGSVRIIHICATAAIGAIPYGTAQYRVILQHLLILPRHLSHTQRLGAI
jgi:hypothetical protein